MNRTPTHDRLTKAEVTRARHTQTNYEKLLIDGMRRGMRLSRLPDETIRISDFVTVKVGPLTAPKLKR